MPSTSIGKCEYCEQFYCQECTTAREWTRFCGKACEQDFEKEEIDGNTENPKERN